MRDAAWRSYLSNRTICDESAKLLKKEYAAAIERLPLEALSKDPSVCHSLNDLAEHLMILFGRGVLSWQGNPEIIPRFFETAPPTIAGYALSFIGRLFHNDDKIPHSSVEHYQTLWDLVVGLPNKTRGQKLALGSFGWWFSSRRFDYSWSLDRLRVVLGYSVKIESDYLVAEVLANVAPNYPQLALRAIIKMIDVDEDGYGVMGWLDSARTILKIGLAADDTRSEAQDAIHKLGARGNYSFRDLLE